MATFAEAATKRKELSSQISTLIRTLSLSVLAVSWIFLSGGKDASELIEMVPKSHMLWIALLCVLAIGLDLAQYIAGYDQVSKDHKRAKALQSDEVIYLKSNARTFCFRAKILVAMVAMFWLVAMLGWAATSHARKEQHKPTEECPGIQITTFR